MHPACHHVDREQLWRQCVAVHRLAYWSRARPAPPAFRPRTAQLANKIWRFGRLRRNRHRGSVLFV